MAREPEGFEIAFRRATRKAEAQLRTSPHKEPEFDQKLMKASHRLHRLLGDARSTGSIDDYEADYMGVKPGIPESKKFSIMGAKSEERYRNRKRQPKDFFIYLELDRAGDLRLKFQPTTGLPMAAMIRHFRKEHEPADLYKFKKGILFNNYGSDKGREILVSIAKALAYSSVEFRQAARRMEALRTTRRHQRFSLR